MSEDNPRMEKCKRQLESTLQINKVWMEQAFKEGGMPRSYREKSQIAAFVQLFQAKIDIEKTVQHLAFPIKLRVSITSQIIYHRSDGFTDYAFNF